MQCVGLPRQQIQTSLFIEFRRIQLCELSGQTLFTFRKRNENDSQKHNTCFFGTSYNQIVFICAFLTNFQPVLIPIPDEPDDSDVGSYFKQLSDLDDDSDNAESSECDA